MAPLNIFEKGSKSVMGSSWWGFVEVASFPLVVTCKMMWFLVSVPVQRALWNEVSFVSWFSRENG